MNINKTFLISLSVIFGILTIFFIVFYPFSSLKEFEKKDISEILIFPNIDTLYISASTWGLAGNHEEIILSKTSINENYIPNKETDYIFYTTEIYYRKNENKLIIYVNESSVLKPKNFKTSIDVEIKGLKTAGELNDYELNYIKYGLTKLSVFDKK